MNNIEFLDLVNILSLAAQIQNLEQDDKYERYIKNFVERIEEKIDRIEKKDRIKPWHNSATVNL